MNYKKSVLTLKDERQADVFIVEIQNNAPRGIKVNFLKRPIGKDFIFYKENYANDTNEETIISDILKRMEIEKKSGYYFIREERLE